MKKSSSKNLDSTAISSAAPVAIKADHLGPGPACCWRLSKGSLPWFTSGAAIHVDYKQGRACSLCQSQLCAGSVTAAVLV